MSRAVTRLYEQFKPKEYDVSIELDKGSMSFSGHVIVRGQKTGRPSKRITLHQKDLSIDSATVLRHGKKNEEVVLSRVNTHNAYDEVRLHSKELIYPGEYTLKLSFKGKISKSMHGIYPCFYKNKGQEKTLIATQFESHHAREAFPCIDEPEAKAIFNLEVIIPKNEVVIGNTPEKSSKIIKDKRHTLFEPSPIMSSYLLAFVAGEMHYVEAKTKSGVTVRSWANITQPKDHLNYATKEAVDVLEFFIDYFKTPFPLKKLDLAALPDFESLAMENWGLITFREVGILSDPKNRSLSGEQLITLVIAHEISHQWFGNLVTMKWWDDLWLNESFASIMENVAPDRLHADWNQWEDFTTGRVLSSAHRDIYKDVQAVSVKVKHPDEISTLFDPSIVYAKGARLLSMLLEYIGEDNFRKGLQLYFKENAYKNTTRDDLWKALSSVCKQDIGKLMTPWIDQSGQPLLSVSLKDKTLSLSQKRFLMDGDDNKSLWPIPLLSQPPLDMDVLSKKEAKINLKNSDLPIFNVNGSGHYIVKYEDDKMLSKLTEQIEKRSLNSLGRITTLNDMLLLSRAGEYPLSTLLEIVRNCPREPRDAVWSMFVRIIGQAQALTDGDLKTEKYAKQFKRELARYWYEKLGWNAKPNDEPNIKHLRNTAVALSVTGEDKLAVAKALELYKKAGSVEKLPADQRAIIAGAAVRFGESKFIDQLMSEYTESINPDVQSSITAALCSTRDVDVAKKIIDWGMKPEKGVIRQQDIDHWYAYLMRNHYTRDLAWQWMVKSWDYVSEQNDGGKHIEYFVWYSAGPISTPAWRTKFKKFFEPKLSEPNLRRNILVAFSEIDARVDWRKREEKDLKQYFSKTGLH